MPERARTDLWEPQGSNPLGPPGPELGRGPGKHEFLRETFTCARGLRNDIANKVPTIALFQLSLPS